MIMVFYIVGYLANDKDIRTQIATGATLQSILGLGIWVIGIFSVLFLAYTNSFITKRRKREFGLFNVLGMGKWNIARVMLCENIIVNAVSITGGLFLGILLSKLVQAVLFYMLGHKSSILSFPINWFIVILTIVLFTVIFALILIDSLRQIAFSNTIDLLHSSNVGEREPKANWVMALIGVIFLCVGYYMAQTVKNPIAAITLFFVAVIFVIIGTYSLFISGSVALMKLLKRNKSYYYKANHFISVSGMTYRMKRNGAGLASICILSTMVLVMVSTTVCLYVGIKDTSRMRYPMDITATVNRPTYVKSMGKLKSRMWAEAEKLDIEIAEAVEYYSLISIAKISDNGLLFPQSSLYDNESESNSVLVDFITIDSYNKSNRSGDTISLADNEVFLYTYGTHSIYKDTTIKIVGEGGEKEYNIKSTLESTDNFPIFSAADWSGLSHIIIFLPNESHINDIVSIVYMEADEYGRIPIYSVESSISGYTMLPLFYYVGWNLAPEDNTLENVRQLTANLSIYEDITSGEYGYVSADSFIEDYEWAMSIYSGLLLVAIVLGLVFTAGAVLIMYYKQVTEGYEDAGRYEIMEKVGMTDSEIRRSINSQVLTVFFLPLVTAGLHIIFAFNMINQLLMLLGLSSAFLVTTLVCFAVFALFYVSVYLITSQAYYRTIRRGKQASL